MNGKYDAQYATFRVDTPKMKLLDKSYVKNINDLGYIS